MAPTDDPEFPAPRPDAESLGDIVGRDRRTTGLALRARPSGRTYSYRDFVTTSYKAGNVLRYLGVRPGDEVQIAAERVPETVLTFFGAAQLGAVTRFGEAIDGEPPRAAVVPAAREAEIDLPPGHHLVVYDDPPESPDVTHWETEVWSENPAIHPVDVATDDPLLAVGERTYTHGEVMAVAAGTAADAGLGPGTEVTVRGPPTDPAVVAGGLVAPILAGSTIVLASESEAAHAPAVTVDGVGVDLGGLGGGE